MRLADTHGHPAPFDLVEHSPAKIFSHALLSSCVLGTNPAVTITSKESYDSRSLGVLRNDGAGNMIIPHEEQKSEQGRPP